MMVVVIHAEERGERLNYIGGGPIIGEKRNKQKIKHQRIQPPESCIFNRSDLKLFRNAKTPWIIYCCLPPNNPCSPTLLTYLQTPPGTHLHTSEVSVVNFLIREGKQYQYRWLFYWYQELSGYHHHHNNLTPLLCNHATPLLTMDHHLYNLTFHPSPLHGSPPPSCQTSPIYVDHYFPFMYTIILVAYW